MCKKCVGLRVLVLSVAVGLSPVAVRVGISQTPDCKLTFALASGEASASFDNRFAGCGRWSLVWTKRLEDTVAVKVQGTRDNGGAPLSGSWVDAMSITGASVGRGVGLVQVPWLRVLAPSFSSGGRISGSLHGYRDVGMLDTRVYTKASTGSATYLAVDAVSGSYISVYSVEITCAGANTITIGGIASSLTYSCSASQ